MDPGVFVRWYKVVHVPSVSSEEEKVSPPSSSSVKITSTEAILSLLFDQTREEKEKEKEISSFPQPCRLPPLLLNLLLLDPQISTSLYHTFLCTLLSQSDLVSSSMASYHHPHFLLLSDPHLLDAHPPLFLNDQEKQTKQQPPPPPAATQLVAVQCFHPNQINLEERIHNFKKINKRKKKQEEEQQHQQTNIEGTSSYIIFLFFGRPGSTNFLFNGLIYLLSESDP